MPSAGPVLSYPVTQQTGGQNGQSLQFIAHPPGAAWTPQQIVSGFLIAAAAFGNQEQVAKEYLTHGESKTWNPTWNAVVYQTGPNVTGPVYQAGPSVKDPLSPSTGSQPGGKSGKSGKRGAGQPPQEATVAVNGKVQAILSTYEGTYAVPSASGPDSSGPWDFTLVKTGDGWRISYAPSKLLLTQAQFADDYELRNLYFFDPNYHSLVPDPVYVPLQDSASTLTSRLVDYLKKPPPNDWLAGGATQTAFPPGTKVSATLVNNLATVNVTGTITPAQRAEVASQLLWTLVGSGQGGSQVQSVELVVNGKPFYPAGSTVNYVQTKSQASHWPATGSSATGGSQVFYYLGSGGDVYSSAGVAGKQVRIAKIGAGYSQIAVSQDGRHLAALRDDGALFIGPVGGPLVRQLGSGYATLSWDPTGNLWTTTGSQIFVLRNGADPNGRQAKPILVTVTLNGGVSVNEQFVALQVAPDGVRVALITDQDELTFGAIVWEPGTVPGLRAVKMGMVPTPGAVKIQLSPFSVSDPISGFTEVTWYGPDNVITLGSPSTLTEYPVNGGTPTSQMLDQNVESITATAGTAGPGAGQALIAGVAGDEMLEAPTLTGAWAPILTQLGTPVRGISPIYPG
jgi:Lipoprotein LpqB beta-propeller domain/Sporulation and spore germination